MKMNETQIQKQLVKILIAGGITHFHPANEGKKRGRTVGQLKYMGVYPGVPDLIIIGYRLPVLFLELKAEGGRLSKDQVDWQGKIERAGHVWRAAYCLDEALGVLKELGYLK